MCIEPTINELLLIDEQITRLTMCGADAMTTDSNAALCAPKAK